MVIAREARMSFEEAMEGFSPLPLPDGLTVADLLAADRQDPCG
jgi:hypothetical protein